MMEIESSKIKKDIKIANISNIKFSDRSNDDKISHKVLDKVVKIDPTHIVICGNLFTESIKDKERFDGREKGLNVFDFLNMLSEKAEVFYTPGVMDPNFDILKNGVYHYCNPNVHLLSTNQNGVVTPSTYYSNSYNALFSSLKIPPFFETFTYEEKRDYLFTYLNTILKEVKEKDAMPIILCAYPYLLELLSLYDIESPLILKSSKGIRKVESIAVLKRCKK